MFSELYRVMVKEVGKVNFSGTGSTSDGGITIEGNIIHQSFYTKKDAIKISEELEELGFETKIVKGS